MNDIEISNRTGVACPTYGMGLYTITKRAHLYSCSPRHVLLGGGCCSIKQKYDTCPIMIWLTIKACGDDITLRAAVPPMGRMSGCAHSQNIHIPQI